jgi:hypothetical protein
MAHIVTAPLVITKKEDGSDLYLYQGSVVPSNVSASEIKRLSERQFIEKIGSAEADQAPAPSSQSN